MPNTYFKLHIQFVFAVKYRAALIHRKERFLDEYRKMLHLFEIEYDEQYLFKELI